MDPEQVSKLIEHGLPDAQVSVKSGDNTHYTAVIVSELFAGKRPLARHQMVYQCLGKLMGNEIHALAIRAHTPGEWRELELAGSAAPDLG
jgi:acid stress-induced BolA-like protein IbaG/YrbA